MRVPNSVLWQHRRRRILLHKHPISVLFFFGSHPRCENKSSPATAYKSSFAGVQGWRPPTRLRKGSPCGCPNALHHPLSPGFPASTGLARARFSFSNLRCAPRHSAFAVAMWRLALRAFGTKTQNPVSAKTPNLGVSTLRSPTSGLPIFARF